MWRRVAVGVWVTRRHQPELSQSRRGSQSEPPWPREFWTSHGNAYTLVKQVERDGGRHKALSDLRGTERQVKRQRAEAQARRQRVLHETGNRSRRRMWPPSVIMRTMTSPLLHRSGRECSATGRCTPAWCCAPARQTTGCRQGCSPCRQQTLLSVWCSACFRCQNEQYDVTFMTWL